MVLETGLGPRHQAKEYSDGHDRKRHPKPLRKPRLLPDEGELAHLRRAALIRILNTGKWTQHNE